MGDLDARDSSGEHAILTVDACGPRSAVSMGGADEVDEKKHGETAMGEPASAREKTAQNADEVAMGRSSTLKDIDARSDAQTAMG